MSTTTLWPWPHRDADGQVLGFGARERQFLRQATVFWDSAEWRAPGLADAGFEPIEALGKGWTDMVDLFLNTARIARWDGVIENCFATASPRDIEYALADVPDAEVRAMLASGQPIPFAPDADLLRLWQAADKRGTGIDPKRPYGTAHVARDIRAMIDPDKTLGRNAFKARRDRLESEMMLMLLRFVQGAELPFDDYVRDETHAWVPISSLAERPQDRIGHGDWVDRLYLPYVYGMRAYLATMKASAQLMWEGRLQGGFEELCRQMKLGDAWDRSAHGYSAVPLETLLTAGLAGFDEAAHPKGQKPMTRMLVRLLNAQNRFGEALALMERAGERPERAPRGDEGITPALVYSYEWALAELGAEMLRRRIWLDDPELERQAGGLDWSLLFDLLHNADMPPAAQKDLAEHMQAIAAQLQFMRGPCVS